MVETPSLFMPDCCSSYSGAVHPDPWEEHCGGHHSLEHRPTLRVQRKSTSVGKPTDTTILTFSTSPPPSDFLGHGRLVKVLGVSRRD